MVVLNKVEGIWKSSWIRRLMRKLKRGNEGTIRDVYGCFGDTALQDYQANIFNVIVLTLAYSSKYRRVLRRKLG